MINIMAFYLVEIGICSVNTESSRLSLGYPDSLEPYHIRKPSKPQVRAFNDVGRDDGPLKNVINPDQSMDKLLSVSLHKKAKQTK
jgi:hypothetical protein